MKKELVMRYPSSWHGEMWREGAPCGNGLIGALVYGAAGIETIQLNHALLWQGGVTEELPDVSGSLEEIRALLHQRRTIEADTVLSRELNKHGYSSNHARAVPLCDLNIVTDFNSPITGYRRVVNMDQAEVTVSWNCAGVKYTRSVFVSRADNTLYTRYAADRPGAITAVLSLTTHDTETLTKPEIIQAAESCAVGNLLSYSAANETVYEPAQGDYGAVSRVFTDGDIRAADGKMTVSGASELRIATRLYVGGSRGVDVQKLAAALADFDYNAALAAHAEIHSALFQAVDFAITPEKESSSNEELLLESFDGNTSNELMEKLYAYGRYLFICSTSDRNTLPCHLTGLWCGSYTAWWVIYMYNINFEMIYWQALTGNLPGFMRLALDYTESAVEDYRDNAKKLFGCRGLYIESTNTPESATVKCLQNHILNWTGGAAWMSQHFWDYYRFTGDEAYLREHALPFMAESALFFEDFLTIGEDGLYEFVPSVSPENTPGNIEPLVDHTVETARNALMDIALVKELLTNLISASEITGMYEDKVAIWGEMLQKLPKYMINEDGGVKEWSDPFYTDNDRHRHQSHLYPVFPGAEVNNSNPQWEAFVKAEELRYERGLSSISSWGLVNMAATFARMEQSEKALTSLEVIAQTCLMNNFFTLHNDWRRMGNALVDDLRAAPFQIDANIGMTGAVHEMLLQSQFDDLFVLPALPKKWSEGHITGLLARGNILCDIAWDKDSGEVTLTPQNGTQVKLLRIGSGYAFEDETTEKEIALAEPMCIRLKKL